MLAGDTDPWWLAWVVPVVAAITALGGALIWIGRVLLLPGIKQELEELLSKKFEEAEELVEQRHEDNRRDIENLRKLVEEGSSDRKQIRKELSDVSMDVAYLRGRSTGTFKR